MRRLRRQPRRVIRTSGSTRLDRIRQVFSSSTPRRSCPSSVSAGRNDVPNVMHHHLQAQRHMAFTKTGPVKPVAYCPARLNELELAETNIAGRVSCSAWFGGLTGPFVAASVWEGCWSRCSATAAPLRCRFIPAYLLILHKISPHRGPTRGSRLSGSLDTPKWCPLPATPAVR
jgi:hypothetical protein